MDYYSYFRERFTWGFNPYTAMAGCQQIVIELLNNSKIPFRISSAAAADLLAALADYAGNGCTVTATYENIMNAFVDACQRTRDTTVVADKAWLMETQELEQEASGGPPYDPVDFETWPVDMDIGEDEVDGEDSDEDEPREPNGIHRPIPAFPRTTPPSMMWNCKSALTAALPGRRRLPQTSPRTA